MSTRSSILSRLSGSPSRVQRAPRSTSHIKSGKSAGGHGWSDKAASAASPANILAAIANAVSETQHGFSNGFANGFA